MSLDSYGLVYKLAAMKTREPTIMTTLTKEDGTFTNSQEETMELLLNTLVPLDDGEVQDETHEDTIQALVQDYMEPSEDPFTMEELRDCLRKIKTRRASGPDEIPPEAVKFLNSENQRLLLEGFNICWKEGIVPREWKVANLHVLRKGGERDWKNPSSYRPISLLSVVGKTYERLVAMRLRGLFQRENSLHPMQFGFTPGKDTVDAIEEVVGFVRESQEKHVIALFLDIEGAFNNLWWPAILEKLRRLRVSQSIYKMIESYLKDRVIQFRIGGIMASRKVDRGCPQGSVLGPILWNVVMDDLLRMEFPEGSKLVAFADDAVVLCEGRSRLILERKLGLVMVKLEQWARRAKLAFSLSKSKLQIPTGGLDPRRPPVVRLRGTSVGCVSDIRYLGVILDSKLTFLSHAKHVGTKARNLFGQIGRLARQEFGVSMSALDILYNTVAVPIITYASSVWAHKAQAFHIRRTLRASQRQILLTLSGGYRTTSFMGLVVAMAVPPIDLKVKEMAGRRELRKGRREGTKQDLREEMVREWQEEWIEAEHGRATFVLFPEVEERLGLRRLRPDFYTVQLLTSHGAFRTYLHGRGRSDDDRCDRCDDVDHPEHALLRCPAWEEERADLMEKISEQRIQQPTTLYDLVRRETIWSSVAETWKKIHNRRAV